LPKSKFAKATKGRKPKSAKTSDPLSQRSAPSDMAPEKFRAIGHNLVDDVSDFLTRLPKARMASPFLPDATLADVKLLPELIVGIGRDLDERIRPKHRRRTSSNNLRSAEGA
jgi:hypothetical protein